MMVEIGKQRHYEKLSGSVDSGGSRWIPVDQLMVVGTAVVNTGQVNTGVFGEVVIYHCYILLSNGISSTN